MDYQAQNTSQLLSAKAEALQEIALSQDKMI